jgi:hypothetical protein
MFDRLVCASGSPREDLIEHKNAELAMRLEHSPEWQELSTNHLEGCTAAFFCYGDGGGDELDESGRPKLLRSEHKEWFDPEKEIWDDGRQSYAPLVWQCRYSGIEAPDALWTYQEFGRGKKYSDNQAEDMEGEGVSPLSTWTDRFAIPRRREGQSPARRSTTGTSRPSIAGRI